MYARQITNEETYTLAEARRIISVERAQRRERRLEKLQEESLSSKVCKFFYFFVVVE